MANIPLIPGAQQTFSRFRRRGKNLNAHLDKYSESPPDKTKRPFKRSLEDRRQRTLRVRLERRSDLDRRNSRQSGRSSNNKETSSGIGRHINTTA